ncbi:NDR1/HIN1-like protein 1 [Sesamum angolense]|uniref:NDR1/HIN1-like protein 1 n=1 Tax=Sesamum angolense TaxID=2727404 RepID=A0AAE1XAR5_9LAMI|nr:NDR1/HIN1-like protein 1 [Sesamum angolense]
MPATSTTAGAAQRHSFPVRCIAGVLLSLILITGLAVLIIWLSVQPRKLRYSIEEGSISGFNLTNDRLTSNFHFVLRAENPNRRIPLYYDRIDVTVSYEDQKLSVNKCPPLLSAQEEYHAFGFGFGGEGCSAVWGCGPGFQNGAGLRECGLGREDPGQDQVQDWGFQDPSQA